MNSLQNGLKGIDPMLMFGSTPDKNLSLNYVSSLDSKMGVSKISFSWKEEWVSMELLSL